MGVKSTSSHPTNTKKADGHLLEYYRQDFGAGGGASVGSQVTVDFLIIGGGGGGGAGEAVPIGVPFVFRKIIHLNTAFCVTLRSFVINRVCRKNSTLSRLIFNVLLSGLMHGKRFDSRVLVMKNVAHILYKMIRTEVSLAT